MSNLKFPEISKEIQQSVFGAHGGSSSDDWWCDQGMGGELDEVTVYPTYDWGDTFGGEQNDYDEADGYGSGSSSSGSDANQAEGWSNSEFLAYYEGGNGVPVSLHQIGHFENIRNSDVFNALMDRVNDQIEDKIAEYIIAGDNNAVIEYDFLNSYDFTSDVFAIGGAYVSGVLSNLTFITNNGSIAWGGSIYLTVHDVFEDPIDIFDQIPGTFDYGDPFIINESWSEAIDGYMNGAAGNSEYQYGYGY